jgi:hypothetical protein
MGFLKLLGIPDQNALTAATQILQPAPQVTDASSRDDPRRHIYRTPDVWQREVWDFYDTLGEFRQGVTWKANLMSRMRLVAAQKQPGNDEPVPVDSGPAFDVVSDLAGGVGGQASMLAAFSTFLDVPGECYLIGETLPNGVNKWYVRSIEELRPDPTGDGYAIAEGFNRWRKLPDDSMVIRVWRPHMRWHNVASSPARAARSTMRELELVNRHIQSQYLSRLASAGVIIFPDEITFPVRAEFAEAPDPFVAEWIEIAAEAIKEPGTASSIVPIPIRVPGEYIDKIKHVDFTLRLDANIVQKRDSVLTRLAISLDMPPEALLGTRDVNHWNAWLIDEQGVKIHAAPTAEIICDALTEGYLIPRLEALQEAGEDVGNLDDWVMWYDASELILRPDISANTMEAYDRMEANGEALRRELGLNESDKPSKTELEQMILIKAALQPVNTFAALDELGYTTTHDTPPAEPRPPDNAPPDQQQPPNGPPDTPPPPSPSKAGSDITQQLTKQAGLEHAMKIGITGEPELLHPSDCADHLFSCPVTHATWKPPINAKPGTAGVYKCWLNAHGQPIIGERITEGDARGMIVSSHG